MKVAIKDKYRVVEKEFDNGPAIYTMYLGTVMIGRYYYSATRDYWRVEPNGLGASTWAEFACDAEARLKQLHELRIKKMRGN